MKSEIKNFMLKTINGMTYGFFATLIIGTIIVQISSVFSGNDSLKVVHDVIFTVGDTLKKLMGLGIGIGIALSLELKGIRFVTLAVTGGIATAFKIIIGNGLEFIPGLNLDPAITYLVVIGSAIFMKFALSKSTNFDVILVPLATSILAICLTVLLSPPTTFVITQIASFINYSTGLMPIPMSILLSVFMGMMLTGPISSVAIAVAINLEGMAAGAAVIGCATQMVGLAIQSIRENKVGNVLSIFFGTSMLQLKNVIKKPLIWLPTIIASAIVGPIGTILFGIICTKEGAGMGMSGLVGPLQTLEAMNYSGMSFLGIGLCFIIIPAAVVFLFDLLLRKIGWIKPGDLTIEQTF